LIFWGGTKLLYAASGRRCKNDEIMIILPIIPLS
jgi:hypothetical protein